MDPTLPLPSVKLISWAKAPLLPEDAGAVPARAPYVVIPVLMTLTHELPTYCQHFRVHSSKVASWPKACSALLLLLHKFALEKMSH